MSKKHQGYKVLEVPRELHGSIMMYADEKGISTSEAVEKLISIGLGNSYVQAIIKTVFHEADTATNSRVNKLEQVINQQGLLLNTCLTAIKETRQEISDQFDDRFG